MSGRVPYLASRLQGYNSTIFSEMSLLATATGSINLGQGFPDEDGPSEIVEAAVDAVRAGANQYPPLRGIPPLLRAIAEHQHRFYGIELDPDREILVTAGATEAIAATLLALVETGDEVIMFEPYYDSYAACVAMAGGQRRVVPLIAPDWSFDPEQLRAAVNPRTRAILLNTPHNPTGKVFARAELEEIAAICREFDLIAITDEVYEHLVFEGPHVPLSTLPGMAERTVTISSGAKTFSFTGWKVGWASGPEPLIAAVRTAKQFLTYVNAAPLQPAIARALALPDAFFSGIAEVLGEKRTLLAKGLESVGLPTLPTAGTYFLTTDIASHTDEPGGVFCHQLPRRVGVVAIPMDVFFDDKVRSRSLVRWTFCKQFPVLETAIERLGGLATP